MEWTKRTNTHLTIVLAELRREFSQLYGSRLVELILYGSQARGEAAPDSDIDVMVVLSGEVDPWVEIERGGKITAALSLKHDVVISCVYMPTNRFMNDKHSPLLRNVRREGIKL
ncbi:MAG: nucleotidyltransferase domain-containing protein [Anaerolineales bacterium]|nr:nucleotidyltransferase domain-containing protein [Anaerolineales bacterium]